MGAKLVTALFNTLMGMGTVFVVLILISLVISLFKYIPMITAKMEMHKKRKAGEKTKQDTERPAPQRPILTPELEEEEMDEGELVAVITAAIAAASGGAVSADRLVVHSIRRVKRHR